MDEEFKIGDYKVVRTDHGTGFVYDPDGFELIHGKVEKYERLPDNTSYDDMLKKYGLTEDGELVDEFYRIRDKNTELEHEVQQLREQLTREVAVRDDIYTAAHYKWNMLKQRIMKYRYDKTGSHEDDGRYCVAISVTDLLEMMKEIEDHV